MTETRIPSVPVIGRSQTALPFHQTRNPVKHTGRGFRVKFASQKMGRMIRCESSLEMRAVQLGEFARDIVAIEEQPVTLSYEIDGKTRRYTPDFRFRWRDGREWLVEVKPSERLALPNNRRRFARLAEVIADTGATFIVLTEAQLHRAALNDQINQWLRRRPLSFAPNLDAQLNRLWADRIGKAQCTLQQAELALGGKERVQELLATRDLVCDLHTITSAHATVRPFKEGDDDVLFV